MFVESNPTIKWCPYPGCTMAVQNPYINEQSNDVLATTSPLNQQLSHYDSNNNLEKTEFSKSIDCGAGHYICW